MTKKKARKKQLFRQNHPFAKADKKKITTIEGLSDGDSLHPVQQAFLDEGAIQCGYCTPGMILSTVALLKNNPQPTDEQIAESARKIISGKYALVVVAENIAPVVEEAFSDQMDAALPCIVVVPFTTESEGFATQALAQVLKMATGINILQNN